jgi:hypothetical protein
MLGTFGGALEARQIDASNGRLTADVTGRWKRMKGVLVIRTDPRRNAPASTGTGQGDRRARP